MNFLIWQVRKTTTTTTGLGLWDVVLGTWWTVIQGTFNTGRTDVGTEMTGLNNFLGTRANYDQHRF